MLKEVLLLVLYANKTVRVKVFFLNYQNMVNFAFVKLPLTALNIFTRLF